MKKLIYSKLEKFVKHQFKSAKKNYTQILYNSQCFLSPPLPPIFSPPPIQTMPIITNPIVKITKAESSQPD